MFLKILNNIYFGINIWTIMILKKLANIIRLIDAFHLFIICFIMLVTSYLVQIILIKKQK